MKDINLFSKIYIAIDPVDFRKHAHGLAIVAEQALKLILNNDKILVAFTNKNKGAIKFLYWDHTGYALWWKVLEKDRFRWPKTETEVLSIQAKDLRWLLEGIDLSKIKRHEKINFP